MSTSDRRAALVSKRIDDRRYAVLEAVPPIQPPAAHWLDSDAGPSYCWRCAHIARGKEFDLGTPIDPPPSYQRDEWMDAFYEGIDGGFDTTSESTAACDICRCTLSYILTDSGVEEELGYWREQPLMLVRDEDSYALDRLCLNIYKGSPRAILLGAAIAVNQAYRLIQGTAA